MRCVIVLIVLASLAACTWVPIDESGKAVRVLREGSAPEGCISKGEIEVDVKDRVGFYQRNSLRVQEELETLARNSASRLDANAVQPLHDPIKGGQRFRAWQCSLR